MKTETKNKIEELNNREAPIVTIDPSLNKYHGKVLFPKKLAIAEERLKGVKLPPTKNSKPDAL